MTWIRACTVQQVPEDEGLRLPTEPPIAVFRVVDEFFATGDSCTHDEFSLAQGYLDGDVVECPLHMAKFCLRTGKVLAPPAFIPLETYPVRRDGDDLFVDVPERPDDL
ncbi:bifunctional 3-phenylpropionate/cinnamic acid dioxygenase ferredoxin subunit [Geodermatophilus ruber]|uniref:Phenylpropionate dioxygenase ferredoxin subunit n=1 Tax=Geodermatophilus ruber TaxID=504800 RepID=A0A1I4BMM8_9ACTN|nr:bifunctional 3-phenylpropionate/cinnamic acid dioxygenase ferredoxin subunit [Geodermatophilus ruber]SFK69985.1 phenylpropionate dioxygenase ferredoxin subunit [Geodermatophilus ruber]